MDAVMAALRTREMAERVVDILLQDGFDAADIAIVGVDAPAAAGPPEDRSSSDASFLVTGAVASATSGSYGALALGLDETAEPGRSGGSARVSESLAAELSAAATSGTSADLTAFFVGHGVSESIAARYAEEVCDGGYVVVLHAEDRAAAERVEASRAAQVAAAAQRVQGA